MEPIRYPTIQKVKRANNKFVYAIRYYKDGKRAQKSAGARYDIAVKIASSIYNDLVAEASGEKRLVDAPSLCTSSEHFGHSAMWDLAVFSVVNFPDCVQVYSLSFLQRLPLENSPFC